MTPFRLAYLSLTRRKIPTLIAFTAIALAVAASGLLLRLDELSDSRFRTMAAGGDALVGAKAGSVEILLGALNGEGAYPDFLPAKLYETLRTESSLHFEEGSNVSTRLARAMIPILFFGKIHGFRVAGTEESFLTRPLPQDSLSFADGRWPQGAKEVVLGAAVARELGAKSGDRVHVDPWFFADEPVGAGEDYVVSGVLAAKGTSFDRIAYARIADAQAALATRPLAARSVWGANVVQYLLVYMNPGATQPFRDLINKRSVGQFVVVGEAKAQLREIMGATEALGFWLTVFVLALGFLSVLGVLATRFEAMAVQVAILRALGKSRAFVCSAIGWESLLLGGSAVVVGAGLDAMSFPFVRQLFERNLPSADIVRIPLTASSPVWAIAIIAALASGLVPLLRIYQKDVHSILKDGG